LANDTKSKEWSKIMSGELANKNQEEDNLVHIYQEIMQCEEDHAKSVLLLLSEVISPQENQISYTSHTV
jgi:5-deoxy-D-glucuronate isomerase